MSSRQPIVRLPDLKPILVTGREITLWQIADIYVAAATATEPDDGMETIEAQASTPSAALRRLAEKFKQQGPKRGQ